MNHKSRVRHRQLRISSKDKSNGTTSRFAISMGTVAFPDAETVGLQSITIPNMVPNIYNGNNCFIYYLSETIKTTAGINDLIKIKDIDVNIIYDISVGTIAGTPATYNADLTTIETAINAVLPNTTISLIPDPAPVAGQQLKLQVSVVSGNSIQFLQNNGLGLVLGVYTDDSVVINESESVLLPNPSGGFKVEIGSNQYTYNELIPVLQDALTISVFPATIQVLKNNVANPSQPYDDRIIILYTPISTENFYIGSEVDGSTMSPSLGYSKNVSTNIPKANGLVQLFGIKEYYLHCRQTNRQKVQLSDEGKLVSIHAVIPKNVGFGGLLTFTAPQHDFFRIRINRGSNQMKTLNFTLRDVRGNVLVEMDDYEYSFILDVDLIEK